MGFILLAFLTIVRSVVAEEEKWAGVKVLIQVTLIKKK